MEKAVITVRKYFDTIMLDLLLDGVTTAGAIVSKDRKSLDYDIRNFTSKMKQKRINVWEYQTYNGKKPTYFARGPSIEEAEKIDARTYSDINFMILNEMLGLPEQTLEARAA